MIRMMQTSKGFTFLVMDRKFPLMTQQGFTKAMEMIQSAPTDRKHDLPPSVVLLATERLLLWQPIYVT